MVDSSSSENEGGCDNDSTSEDDHKDEIEPSTTSTIGLLLGPLLAVTSGLLLAYFKPSGMEVPARCLVCVTLWMAIWWMTEALPLGVTSLLPLVTFPLLGILKAPDVAQCYSVSISWLFFGGFQLSFAVEKTGLHRRLAFGVMRALGTRPVFLMLGVMMIVATLSMFLSNTSTALMILPMAEAMTSSLEGGERSQNVGKAIMLGIAYSASMGGVGTLIGTPPNGVLAAQAELFGSSVAFDRWLAFGAPLSITMVLLTWVYLALAFKVPREPFPVDHPVRRTIQQRMGPCTQAEVRVALVFGVTVLAWMFRKPLCSLLQLEKGRLEDSTISILATIFLFIIPGKDAHGKSAPLLDWQTLLKTPWHILFLFGGGFALASGFRATKLSRWVGTQLHVLAGLPVVLIVFLEVLVVTFLTEVTSNTATANVLLPVVGELAKAVNVQPLMLMVPAALAASCAFMLPVATPPNAIVFATRRLTIKDMATAGLLLNLVSSVLITAWMFVWAPLWFDLDVAPAEE